MNKPLNIHNLEICAPRHAECINFGGAATLALSYTQTVLKIEVLIMYNEAVSLNVMMDRSSSHTCFNEAGLTGVRNTTAGSGDKSMRTQSHCYSYSSAVKVRENCTAQSTNELYEAKREVKALWCFAHSNTVVKTVTLLHFFDTVMLGQAVASGEKAAAMHEFNQTYVVIFENCTNILLSQILVFH